MCILSNLLTPLHRDVTLRTDRDTQIIARSVSVQAKESQVGAVDQTGSIHSPSTGLAAANPG